MAARYMQRIEINIHEKALCVKYVIYKEQIAVYMADIYLSTVSLHSFVTYV
jgi:hypothetical protein